MKPFVLVVEDEESISTLLQYNLEKEGYEVEVVDDGEEAIDAVYDRKPDMILLDWMLPSMSGVDVCRTLRKMEDMRDIPIIMLTARGEEYDRISGLDSGADDYIVKPFSPRELIARIQAVLRRTRPVLTTKQIEYHGLTVDIDMHKAKFGETSIHLGPTEFRLLCFLMERPGHIFSRDTLLDNVWGHDVYVESRTVDVHIRRLRKALSDTKMGLDEYIQTVRSVGYKVEKPDAMQL